jgi:hypothetical protein
MLRSARNDDAEAMVTLSSEPLMGENRYPAAAGGDALL